MHVRTMEHHIMQYHTIRQSVPLSYGSHLIVMQCIICMLACSFHYVICNFFKLFGCSWDGMGHTVGMARFGRSFVVCLIGRGPPTIYSFQETPSELWSKPSGRVGHVVTCGQETHVPQLNVLQAKPSLPSTLRLRPVVTANILAGRNMLNMQLGLLLRNI